MVMYMSNKSDTVYEYKKIKTISEEDYNKCIQGIGDPHIHDMVRLLKNKINELTIEQNHLMKDFELYKKAFKEHDHGN